MKCRLIKFPDESTESFVFISQQTTTTKRILLFLWCMTFFLFCSLYPYWKHCINVSYKLMAIFAKIAKAENVRTSLLWEIPLVISIYIFSFLSFHTIFFSATCVVLRFNVMVFVTRFVECVRLECGWLTQILTRYCCPHLPFTNDGTSAVWQ